MTDGRKNRKHFSLEEKTAAVEMYSTHTMREVMDKYGCSPTSIRDWGILHRDGLLGESSVAARHCKTHLDREARNVDLVARALAGERMINIAKDLGITVSFAYTIVSKHAASNPSFRAKWEKLNKSRKGGWGTRSKVQGQWVDKPASLTMTDIGENLTTMHTSETLEERELTVAEKMTAVLADTLANEAIDEGYIEMGCAEDDVGDAETLAQAIEGIRFYKTSSLERKIEDCHEGCQCSDMVELYNWRERCGNSPTA